MKKMFIALVFAGTLAGLTSCAGDFNCSCTYDPGSGSDTTLVLPMSNVKKSDAEDACNQAQVTYQVVDPGAQCTLSKQ